jgi:hypothetical protein
VSVTGIFVTGTLSNKNSALVQGNKTKPAALICAAQFTEVGTGRFIVSKFQPAGGIRKVSSPINAG